MGLRAQSAGIDPAGKLLPVRLALQPYPAGVSRYDPKTVQGFEIEARADGVTIRACTRLGLENGLYFMLDRWGCRWETSLDGIVGTVTGHPLPGDHAVLNAPEVLIAFPAGQVVGIESDSGEISGLIACRGVELSGGETAGSGIAEERSIYQGIRDIRIR